MMSVARLTSAAPTVSVAGTSTMLAKRRRWPFPVFPSPQSLQEDEQTWYVGQLNAALAANHRLLNAAMCSAASGDFAAISVQVTALRDLQRSVQANDCLGGKLLLLLHGYYGVPLHPRHLAEWRQNVEGSVEGWFEPLPAGGFIS